MTTSAKLWFLLIYVVILSWIEGDHFNGGTITYKVLKTYDSIVSISLTQIYLYTHSEVYCNDTMIAEQLPLLFFNESWYTGGTGLFRVKSIGYTYVPIGLYCTDYSTALDITVGQQTNVMNLTTGSHFLVVDKGEYWRYLSNQWSIACLINLQIRSNGEYNHPPVVTMISPIYIPEGILQAILIPTIDVDHDEVRCRFANGSDECGDACYPESLPEGTKLLPNCTLSITGLYVDDWYAIAIMIEDFLNSTSTDPLSSIPVQFLIYVQENTTCPSPRLTGPFTKSGQCVGVLVGQPHNIQLIAEHDCSNSAIEDIATLSFPNVIKASIVQNSTFIWSVSLTWTPTVEQVGLQVLCAVAIDSNNVQSNQYCIIFTVAEGNISPCPGETIMPNASKSTDSTTKSYQISSTSYHKNASTNSIVVSPSSNSASPWPWAAPLIAVLAACLIIFCIWFFCYYSSYCYFTSRKDSNINNIHRVNPSTNKNHHTSRIIPTSPSFKNMELHTPTSLTQSYIFGSRHTLKINK